MPLISGLILDSSGKPANGWLRVRASRPFDTSTGLVTTALATVAVVAGVPTRDGSPWQLPPTPDGVAYSIEQDLDGDAIDRFTVIAPDESSMTYTELLFNRGNGAGTAGPYWWDLTGGLDFPSTAVNGDWGYDAVSGDVWRYEYA
ncbi:hypothetical protein [Microbacterium trichothecenolyticum]|uniref:Uncharacterized protein n=1 Tax=Microbacterium trichothecenolyticum TaxID=69370 RepID=A0A0M2H0J2_MICTR|nr:hypothetical protein [Microbacterium trichothecenolyticum]KJL39896.1 hypothetical protein RS82_04109 [Microbacterium trichothecenolyticum]